MDKYILTTAEGALVADRSIVDEAQRRVLDLRRNLVPKKVAYLAALQAYNKAWDDYRRAVDASPAEDAQ